jgi:hypothetical protein
MGTTLAWRPRIGSISATALQQSMLLFSSGKSAVAS